MRLYRKPDRFWARTQADAGKGATAVDVPTDHKGLTAFLNNLRSDEDRQGLRFQPPPKPTEERPARCMDAGSILSRCDGGPDVEAIVEGILKARGYVLRRYASAVATVFASLSKGE